MEALQYPFAIILAPALALLVVSLMLVSEIFRWPLGEALLALAGEMLLFAWRGPLP